MTFLSILTDLSSAVMWMLWIHSSVSSSSCWVFPSLRRPSTGKNWFIFSLFTNFAQWSAGSAKSTWWQVLFILLIITRSGLLARIRWSVRISKSQRILRVSFLFVYIPFGFGRQVKFLSLAQFSLDHPSHSVVLNLVLFWCLFAACSLSCDIPFHICFYISYNCYSILYYQFSHYYCNYFIRGEFFTSALVRVFHWSLSDSKSPQVFRTLLSILADLNLL